MRGRKMAALTASFVLALTSAAGPYCLPSADDRQVVSAAEAVAGGAADTGFSGETAYGMEGLSSPGSEEMFPEGSEETIPGDYWEMVPDGSGEMLPEELEEMLPESSGEGESEEAYGESGESRESREEPSGELPPDEGLSDAGEASSGEAESSGTDPGGAEFPGANPGGTDSSAEALPAASGGAGNAVEGVESAESPALAESAGAALLAVEPLIPAERVDAGDVRDVMGAGVDPAIDLTVDGVKEVYDADRNDPGVLQMAAEMSGKTEDALRDAAAVVAVGAEVGEAVEESLTSAGVDTEALSAVENRQNAESIPYTEPQPGDVPVAYLSSFVLSKVRDGSGDFDETTDLKGNDSSSENGIIRTGDEVTYVFSYSTALGEHNLYNTVSGVRLYLEYRLPLTAEQADFNLGAMPWLRGDGEGGRPVITEEGGARILTGYRVLPEQVRSDGASYCVPGAGTVNCVVTVKDMKSGELVRPSFRAWLGGSKEASQLALDADCTQVDPEVQVSVGPFLYLAVERSNKVTQIRYGTFGDRELIDPATGKTFKTEGSARAFYFAVRCGKKNGSSKGVDSIDVSKRIQVSFSPGFGVNLEVPTALGFSDARTFSMKTEDGNVRGVRYVEDDKNPVDAGFGEIDPASLSVRDHRITFDITGCRSGAPGSVVSQGSVTFIQREDAADAGKKPTYYASLKSTSLKATPLRSETGAEESFETGSEHRIENQLDPSGRWDSHLLLTTRRGSNFPLTSGPMATDAAIGYGMDFNAYISTSFFPKSEADYEKSRDYLLLWDSRKVELRSGAASPVTSSLDKSAVFRYVTKADGSFVAGLKEMKKGDFSTSAFYDTYRCWPDYESAVSFLSSVHPGEEDVHRYICGIVCEVHGIPNQSRGSQYFQRVGLLMRVSKDPAQIGTAVPFLQAVRTYSKQISTSLSDSDGVGDRPENRSACAVRNWNLSPTDYEATRWDDRGVLDPSSLTELNTLHKGNTLYILPYQLSVKERFISGRETETMDLSASGISTVEIRPGFAEGAEVRDAYAILDIHGVTDQGGRLISRLKTLKAGKASGEAVSLEDGQSLPVSDFVEGAPGRMSLSMGDLSDPLDQATLRIVSADGRALGCQSGEAGKPADLVSGSAEDRSWIAERESPGIYRLRHASTGLYLSRDGSGAVLKKKVGGEMISSQLWLVRTDGSGRTALIEAGTGKYLTAGGGKKEGEPAALSPAGGGAQGWSLETVTPPDSTPGVRLTFEGISSAFPLPALTAEYELEKALISGETTGLHRSVISGDGILDPPTKENGHLASVSLAFTEIHANVLLETVDKAEVENGQELTYTISYTNQYDEAHPLDLTDLLPRAGDFGFEDVPPSSGSQEAEAYLASKLAEGARLTLIPGSLRVTADQGSALETEEADDRIRVRGSLKSGERAEVVYRVLVEGAAADDLIRNSCIQRDPFGTVWSNRVETTVLPDPDYEVHLTLMTGGRGRFGPVLPGLAALIAAALLMRRRRREA